MTRFTDDTYSAGEGSTLTTQNSHFRQTGGNLVTTWDKTGLHMFPCPTLTQPMIKFYGSTPIDAGQMGDRKSVV